MPVKVKLMFKITSKALRENLNFDLKESYLDGAFVNNFMIQLGLNSRIKIVGQEKYAVLGQLDGTIFASFGLNVVTYVENSREVNEQNDNQSFNTLILISKITISTVLLLIIAIVMYFIYKYIKKKRFDKTIKNVNIDKNQEVIGPDVYSAIWYNNTELHQQYANVEEMWL